MQLKEGDVDIQDIKNPPDDIFISVPQKQPAGGGIYAVRFLILMQKETFKKLLEGKVTS